MTGYEVLTVLCVVSSSPGAAHPVDGRPVLVRADLDDLPGAGVADMRLVQHALPPGSAAGTAHPAHQHDHHHPRAQTHDRTQDLRQQDVRVPLSELQVPDLKVQVTDRHL